VLLDHSTGAFHVRRYDDVAAAWEAAGPAVPGGGVSASLACDGPIPYVASSDDAGTYVRRLSEDELSWEDVGPADPTDALDVTHPVLALDSSGAPVFAWHDGSAHVVRYNALP
jgi:hypothetical protein